MELPPDRYSEGVRVGFLSGLKGITNDEIWGLDLKEFAGRLVGCRTLKCLDEKRKYCRNTMEIQ